MLNLSKRSTIVIAAALSLVMLATRGHHAASPLHLPDASWAMFFLLGFYVRSRIMLPVFMALAAAIDYVAITRFGVSAYCVTPAYAFLLPAYSALWLAGRWYASQYRFQLNNLPLFAAAVVAGTAVCELISSGSFYFLGGRIADTSLAGFASRLVQYFPANLGNVALYLGLAVLVHALVVSKQHVSKAAH